MGNNMLYYGQNNQTNDYGWGMDTSAMSGVTDAMQINGPGKWDGAGGVDLGGTNDIAGGNTSFMGDAFSSFDKSVGTLGKIGTLGASLGGIYVGLKSLGIAEDELDIKKDQWAMSKAEMQHMQATRKRLTASYMGNSGGSKSTAKY